MDDEWVTELAIRIATDHVRVPDRDIVLAWCRRMLEIRASSLSDFTKIQRSVAVTADTKVIVSYLNIVTSELIRSGWAQTSWLTKASGFIALGTLAIIGMPILFLFGGGVGTLAALSSWLVLGTHGHIFLQTLRHELLRVMGRA